MATEVQIKKKNELEAKYPDRKIGLVLLRDKREFWIRSPDRQAWSSFKEAVMDKVRKKVAMENLAATNCIDPGPEALQKMFEREPALAETIADKVATLAGHDDEAELVDFPNA